MTERRPVDFIDMSMPAGAILMGIGALGLIAGAELTDVPLEFDFRPLILIGLIMMGLGAIAHQVRR